jgi:hypothetical protein
LLACELYRRYQAIGFSARVAYVGDPKTRHTTDQPDREELQENCGFRLIGRQSAYGSCRWTQAYVSTCAIAGSRRAGVVVTSWGISSAALLAILAGSGNFCGRIRVTADHFALPSHFTHDLLDDG